MHLIFFFSIDEIPGDYVKNIATISIADYIEHKISGTPNILPMPQPEYFEAIERPGRIDKVLTPELQIKLERAKEFLNEID